MGGCHCNHKHATYYHVASVRISGSGSRGCQALCGLVSEFDVYGTNARARAVVDLLFRTISSIPLGGTTRFMALGSVSRIDSLANRPRSQSPLCCSVLCGEHF